MFDVASLSASAALAFSRSTSKVSHRQHSCLWRCTRLLAELPSGPTREAYLPARPLRETPASAPKAPASKLGSVKPMQPATDDFGPRNTQQPLRANTGFGIVAIIVGEQKGRGWLKHDRAEQRLEFLRTIYCKPKVGGSWLGEVVEFRTLLSAAPVDPGSRRGLKKTLLLQTEWTPRMAVRTQLYH